MSGNLSRSKEEKGDRRGKKREKKYVESFEVRGRKGRKMRRKQGWVTRKSRWRK